MITTNNELLQLLDRLYQEDTAETITLQECAPGEYLCQQGRNVRNVIVIRCGIVKAFHIEENTKKYILSIHGFGQVIGDWEALGNIQLFQNSVIALTHAEFYKMSVKTFLHLCDTNPKFCRAMLTDTSHRMALSLSRASKQLLYPMKHALSRIIEEMRAQNLTLSKQDMADYLGVELRTINRLLKEIATF